MIQRSSWKRARRCLAVGGIGLGVLAVGGCTVESTSGVSSMPADLRSSSDLTMPIVGSAAAPSTQPTAMGKAKAVFIDLPRLAWDSMRGTTMLDAAENLKAPEPDKRRDAIAKLVARDVGKGLPYTDVYKSMGQFDADPLVRATAIRAINRARDNAARPVLTVALSDGHPSVRLEAAKALSHLPDPAAEPRLRQLLANADEPTDTRIASADALRHFKTLDTQRGLIAQLNSQNFGVAWQCRRSLFLMTGQDLGYDEAAWLNAATR